MVVTPPQKLPRAGFPPFFVSSAKEIVWHGKWRRLPAAIMELVVRTVCSPPTDSQHLLLILDGSLTLDILLRDLHHEYALVTLDGALCSQLERLSEPDDSVFFG